VLPRAMMGEGAFALRHPSPIPGLGITIVPSPARGEGHIVSKRIFIIGSIT
jgi:hypothetical protein